MSAPTYTKTGNKATANVRLHKDVFDVDINNHELLKRAYVAYLANGRPNLAKVKTRGEVRGGGKKPWRQKGTGRARFGSSRNPIWKGGGITFGPTGNENYTHSLPKSLKQRALRQALSVAAKDNRIKIVENYVSMDGKTKDMSKFLEKIEAKGQILAVVSQKDPSKERATHNIPQLWVVAALYLNVFDVLNADTIIISRDALTMIVDWLGAKNMTTTKGTKE